MFRVCRALMKGEMALNILHDGNPQYGAPYTTQDRVMREDEIEDFLKSVRGWQTLSSGAITKDFVFEDYWLAYEWMGRVLAFAYTSSKYPRLHWEGKRISVTVYSGHFKGLSNAEAVLAAFMNDQFFLIKKAAEQRDNLLAMTGTMAEDYGVDVDAVRHPKPAFQKLDSLSPAMRDLPRDPGLEDAALGSGTNDRSTA
jgi:pterin-4a-carbinolamine dehydratase